MIASVKSFAQDATEQAEPIIADCALSIVMPCLNEAETLGTCITKAKNFLEAHHINGEIVIGDNGSTDGSQKIAEGLGARVVHIPVRGYGAALIGAITAAHSNSIIMGDSDDSYDFGNLMPFVNKLNEGYDLVMGNRFAGGIKLGAMPLLHRYLGNPVLSFIGRVFFKAPIGDFHCGLRAFRKDAILKLNLRTTGMEFASEMVVKATLHSLRMAEVPTVLHPDGRSRAPHLNTWRDGWRHLRFLMLYSPRWLFLYPGLLLMIVGSAITIWLLSGAKIVGSVGLDVNTMLYAAFAILIGFQAIIFAVFTKVFAISEGLLPDDPDLERWMRFINLEKGLVVGVLLALLGVIMSIFALEFWQKRGFGPLNPSESLRIVIPAVTIFALGCQIVLSSFFLSILGLKRR